SVEIDDLQIQRELVDMRTGESGLVDGGNLTLREMEHEKGKVFPGDDASSGEPGEGVGQSVGLERHGTVHDVEMEVRPSVLPELPTCASTWPVTTLSPGLTRKLPGWRW